MKKFDRLIDKVFSDILFEAQPNPGLPQNGGPVVPPEAPGSPPAPPAQAPQPPAQAPVLTSEGKMFLVQLALKALAVEPSTISEQDKAIFEAPVTTANADQIADRIKQIVEGL